MPWSYPTESTVAAGPMEIYRVPGSVSFLHSGALLHAILPRSQCWCVDGVSKFAFRVLPETYYRIELPGKTEEELALVEALKVTLKKVLFYERTPCPFARGFTVELPKEEVKVKKRHSVREGPAKKWRLQKAYSWKPEGWEEEERNKKLNDPEARIDGEQESQSSAEEDGSLLEKDEIGHEEEGDLMTTPLKSRPKALGSMRSVTAPSKLQAQYTPPPSRVKSRVEAVEGVDRAEKAERVRFNVEVDRRSSIRASRVSAIPIDLPPSPPESSAGAEFQSSDDAREQRDEDELDSQADSEATNERQPPNYEANADGPSSPCQINDKEKADALDQEIKPSKSTNTSDTAELDCLRTNATPEEMQQASTDSSTDKEVVHFSDEDSLPHQLSQIRLSNVNEAANESNAPPLENAKSATSLEDPYAAIQARIQARRSIGGSTTSFQPVSNPSTRKSTSSTSSTATIASQRSQKAGRAAQRHHSITAALVNKACAVFLGPPAHLVTMMLRIAARFSSGAMGSNSMFLVESPMGSPRRVPGSFYLEGEEDQGWKSDEDDWEEDDFGVPLKSPVRISGVRERARREGWDMG